MIVSKAWFLAKSPGVNGLMQVRICTKYITYTYKIKCQGKTDEGKATVEIVKKHAENMKDILSDKTS